MILLIKVKGAVQGVGYRPFIAQKATEYGLKGYVKNIGAAVEILAEGDKEKLDAFSDLLKKEYPAGAFILDVEISEAFFQFLFFRGIRFHDFDLKYLFFFLISAYVINALARCLIHRITDTDILL